MSAANKARTVQLSAFAHGFDLSSKRGAYVRVACSQCEALVINGVPTHERGCPNALHECAGCNLLIPEHERYCEDCA